MGESVKRHLAKPGSVIPLGVELHSISFQNTDTVTESVNAFCGESRPVGRDLVVNKDCCCFSPWACAARHAIIRAILMITICSNVRLYHEGAQGLIHSRRISLGALIIALEGDAGADSAIVITAGMLIAIKRSGSHEGSKEDIVTARPPIPLLPGSTAVFRACLAAGAIGLFG